jgi:hypothetical protein
VSVMLSIGKHRSRRRNLSLLGVFCVAISVLASCGGAEKFELVLRSRADDGSSQTLEHQWLSADGRHATSPEISSSFQVRLDFDYGDVECGGQRMLRHGFAEWGSQLASKDDSFDLKIDDGNGLRLDPQTAVTVDDGAGPLCFEETGRWRGTAGDLRNHEGTFTMHYDTIQTTLHLVED